MTLEFVWCFEDEVGGAEGEDESDIFWGQRCAFLPACETNLSGGPCQNAVC